MNAYDMADKNVVRLLSTLPRPCILAAQSVPSFPAMGWFARASRWGQMVTWHTTDIKYIGQIESSHLKSDSSVQRVFFTQITLYEIGGNPVIFVHVNNGILPDNTLTHDEFAKDCSECLDTADARLAKYLRTTVLDPQADPMVVVAGDFNDQPSGKGANNFWKSRFGRQFLGGMRWTWRASFG